jgi:UDP-N-acetyl-D-glucosamine dehydrogenase
MRESPALKILTLLRDRGADLVYHDPHVPELSEFGLKSASLYEALDGAECAVIVTAHPSLDVGRVLATAPSVVDFRGATRGVEAPNLIRL